MVLFGFGQLDKHRSFTSFFYLAKSEMKNIVQDDSFEWALCCSSFLRLGWELALCVGIVTLRGIRGLWLSKKTALTFIKAVFIIVLKKKDYFFSSFSKSAFKLERASKSPKVVFSIPSFTFLTALEADFALAFDLVLASSSVSLNI